MAELIAGGGVLDTSVLIEPDRSRWMPAEPKISMVSLAELGAGTRLASDALERQRRAARLLAIEAALPVLPFDDACARAYGIVFEAVTAAGRDARSRALDLMIAASAATYRLPLYTLNPDDVRGLDLVLTVVDCTLSEPEAARRTRPAR